MWAEVNFMLKMRTFLKITIKIQTNSNQIKLFPLYVLKPKQFFI